MDFKDKLVLVRRGKKWWFGSIEDGKFISEGECEGLESFDAEERKWFVSLYRYAQILGLDMPKKDVDDIRKNIGYSEILVKDEEPPEPTGKTKNITMKAWNEYWFKNVHWKCASCKKSCKQASRVYLFCSSYEKKD